jgi:hypothetical protein
LAAPGANTVTIAVSEAEQPKLLVAVSVGTYVPIAVYVLVGFITEDVEPSPKLHEYDDNDVFETVKFSGVPAPAEPGLTDAIAIETALTDTVFETVHPDFEYTIVTVPPVFPVTIPVVLPIEAIEGFELDHVPPVVSFVRVIVLPGQTEEAPAIAAGDVPMHNGVSTK